MLPFCSTFSILLSTLYFFAFFSSLSSVFKNMHQNYLQLISMELESREIPYMSKFIKILNSFFLSRIPLNDHKVHTGNTTSMPYLVIDNLANGISAFSQSNPLYRATKTNINLSNIKTMLCWSLSRTSNN